MGYSPLPNVGWVWNDQTGMQEYNPDVYARLMGESPEYFGLPEPDIPPTPTEDWLEDLFDESLLTPTPDFDLAEGWTLKEPSFEGELPTLISPEGKEMDFQDVVVTPSGQWIDRLAFEEQQALLAPEDKAAEYRRLLGDVFLDEFVTDIDTVMEWAQENPQAFRERLLQFGHTKQTEALLKYVGMTQEEVTQFYGGKPFVLLGEPEQVAEAFERVFPDTDVESLRQLAETEPGVFLSTIREKGWTSDTEVVLKGLFPGITWDQISTIFKVDQVGTPEFISQVPVAGEVEIGTPESKFKDIMDAFKLATDRMIFGGAKFMWSALPNFVFQDVPKWGSESGREQINKMLGEVRGFFAEKYANLKQNEEKYYESVPELMPRTEWESPVLKDTSRLKDPWYWGYLISSNAPVSLAALATTVLTAGAGAPAGLAMLAGAGVMTSVQTQDVYEDLLANGASEEMAGKMALPIGALISTVEVMGDLPLLRALSPTFMKLFTKEAGKQMAKLGMAQIIKKGLLTAGQVEISETLEEIAQQAIQNAAVKVINENRSLIEGLDETAIQAAIASLPFAFVGGAGRVSQLRYSQPGTGAKAIELVKPDGTVQVVGQVTETEELITVTEVSEDPELARQVMEWTEQQGKEVKSEVAEIPEERLAELKEAVMPEAPKIKPAEKVVAVTPVEKPEVPTLPSQVRDSILEVRRDVDLIKLESYRRKGLAAKLERAVLRNADAELQRIDRMVRRLEGRGEATAAQLKAVQDRLIAFTAVTQQKAADIAGMKQALGDYVKVTLPVSDRAKMLDQIAKVKTDEQLTKALAKVNELAEVSEAKALRNEIIAELKKAKARKVEGIVKGRFGVGAQELLDTLRNNVAEGRKLDVDTSRASIDALNESKADLMQKYDAGTVDYAAMESQLTAMELERAKFINGMNSFELDALLDDIQSIELTGRTVWGEKLAAEEERLEKIRTEVINEVTGEKGIKPGEGVLSREQLEKKRGWIQKLIDNQLGFGELMSELNIVKGKVEAAVNQFERLVQQARNKENAGVVENKKTVITNFQRIFGLKNAGQVTDLLNKMHNEEVDLGTFKVLTDKGVQYFNIKKPKAALLYHFAQLQDPTVEQTYYETMKWTPEITTAIVNNLTEQEMEWVASAKSFLQDYFPSIDTVYSDIFGVHLGNNPNYFPLNRDYESGVPENVMTFRDLMRYASEISGSFKARVASRIAIKDMDFNLVLFNHIEAMEHFKGWAYTMRDLRRVFGNKQVKTAIRQYHGRDFVKRIDDYMNLMARGGVDKVLTTRFFDKLRGNFATAILTPKPLIALQQIPAIFAYWSQMPSGDFFSGMADFWANPIEHAKWMAEHSDYIKARYSLGMERDIRVAEKTNTFAAWSGRSNFAKKLFTLIETGDKVGVFPGWWAKYKSALKHGMTEQQAMIEADIASNRTQNTSEVETLSAWQNGGTFWKLMTMFQNQPNKYFRLINDNVRNIKYDRGSKAKSAGIILLAWVILPGLYSIIGNAFRYKRDRFLKEVMVAPINDLLIIGQMAQTVWGWLAKEPFEWRVSPVLDTAEEIKTAIQKALKMVEQGKDPYEDLSIDDVIAFIEAIAKAGGQLAGIPTPYLIQVERAIRRGEPKELIWSQWALKEPAKPQDKINKFLLGLGLPIIDPNQPETPFSEKLPDIYDMRKLNSDFNSVLGNTLPSDIMAKKGYDAVTIAWSEMRTSRETYESLPNVPLYKINTDLSEDDTIVQYYQQWQARQQIKSLAELEEFDKLYPKAYLGNVTREQYEMMVEYADLQDDKDRKAYLETHTALLVNPHEEWLKAHALDNARLAIWGQAKVLTQQAYDLAIKMVNELKLPEDALDKYLPPAEVAKDYFTYQELVSKYSAGDAEVKLLVAKSDRLRDFLGREKIDTPINVLELQVKYRQDFDQWDAYANKDSELYIADEKERAAARQRLLVANPDFADDRRRRDAYTKGGSDQMANSYLEYSKLVDKWSANSAEARLYRLEHPELESWAQQKETFYWTPLQGENIKSLKISVRWRDMDDKYQGMANRDSPFYIADETMRAQARAKLLKDNIPYADDRRRRDAYGQNLSDKIIEDYVTWFDITKPLNYDKNLPWFDDDWYLMEHKDFYNEMVTLGQMEKRDFSKVPSRDVFNLYQQYLKVLPGTPRVEFRLENPELDDWLVLAFGYKPAERPKKTKVSPWEDLRRKIWELGLRA